MQNRTDTAPPLANGALLTAVREHLADAASGGRPTPGRRALAAALNVKEYDVRQALLTLQRAPVSARRAPRWPLLLLALPAFVAIWGGWVGLGRLAGFGRISLLPGIWDGAVVDSAITLPIGLETYAAYAMFVWLTRVGDVGARGFARRSALAALGLGMLGQVAFHIMTAAGVTTAPWPITAIVATLPVVVFGMGAALAHLLHEPNREEG